MKNRFFRIFILVIFILSCLPQKLVYAATIPSGIMVAWPSTNASIPSGWTRETQLDALYIQGAAAGADADLTTARGAATHIHTSPSHTPLQNSHTHTAEAPNGDPDLTDAANLTGNSLASTTHTHGIKTSTATTATNNGITITVNANTSNDIPYVAVIWIKSNGTPTGIPSNSYAFFSSDTLPASWTRVQGNTYLKGAAAGGDGGGTGGSATHTHTSPAHTHTQNAHSHTLTTPNGIGSSSGSSGVSGAAQSTHTHSLIFDSLVATNQSVTTTLSTDNHEPVFKKLNIINNGTGGVDLPTSIICIWGGTNAGIPADFVRFTSMDGNFVKGANADGESNVTTGGAATHTHTASNCQPIQNSHVHTITDNGTSPNVNVSVGTTGYAVAGHSHANWNPSTTTATNQSVAVTINANTSESAYPSYRKVIFVQYSPAPAGPGRTRRVHLISWIFVKECIQKEET